MIPFDDLATLDDKIWRLRLGGSGYPEIARRLSVTIDEVHKVVVARELDQLSRTAGDSKEAARARELARLDLLGARMASITDWTPEVSGGRPMPSHNEVIKATNAQLKISKARRKMLGLDTPEVHEHRVSGTLTHVHDLTHLARLLSRLPEEHFAALRAAEVAFAQLEEGPGDGDAVDAH